MRSWSSKTDGHALAELVFECPPPSERGEANAAPQHPGLITGASAQRLLLAARHGRLTSAWKQLFSRGIAPPNQDTVEKLLQPHEAGPVFSAAAIRQASRGLKHGTAPDALGWTTESWQALTRRPELMPVVQELLLQYVTGHSGGLAQDLINSSRLIALYKDSQGASLRPIAIPTVWRKIIGRASVTHFRDVLRHAAGDFQYAAMTPDGGARMAAATRWQSQAQQERVFVRTDIQNAFNEIQRHSVYEALSYSSPLLAATQFAWLCRPSIAVLENPASVNGFLATTTGIPQRDPLSSLAFAVALARPIRDLQTAHPDSGVVAYADDVLLDSPADAVHRVVNTGLSTRGTPLLELRVCVSTLTKLPFGAPT